MPFAYLFIFAIVKILKKHITFLLMFTAISYSLNIHGLTHVFEDSQTDDKQHCEICIVNHQKHQDSFSLTPVSENFNFKNPVETTTTKILTVYAQNSTQNLFLEGQLFNRPPPLHI